MVIYEECQAEQTETLERVGEIVAEFEVSGDLRLERLLEECSDEF